MKKLFLSLFVVMSMSVGHANASTSTVNARIQKVESFLELQNSQVNEARKSMTDYYDLMQKLTEQHETNATIKKATNAHLKQMHRVLSPEQYRKYLQVLNATLQNHGVDYR